MPVIFASSGQGFSGIGPTKLERYGDDILRILTDAGGADRRGGADGVDQ